MTDYLIPHADHIRHCGEITVGQTLTAHFEFQTGMFDGYALALNADERVVIHVEASAEMVPGLSLTDMTGSLLADSAEESSDTTATAHFTAETAGQYAVLIHSVIDESGDYTLSVEASKPGFFKRLFG